MTSPCILAKLDATQSIIVWSLVLICVIIIGMAVTLQVKRKVTETGPANSAGGGFTLSDLRQMAKEGTITPEEFEKAKVKIVEAAKRATDRRNQAQGKDLPRV
jgi:hypothetical protein